MYTSTIELIRGIRAYLASCGFEVDALFVQAGLEESECVASDALALSDKFSHLWELLAQVSGDPLVGLKAPPHQPSGWLGLIDHIMLVSPDVKTAIENLVRYTSLVSPTVHSTIAHANGRTRISLRLAAGQRPVPQQRYDFVWCMLLRALRCAAGRDDLKPLMVAYAFPAPPATQAYEDAFGCAVRFDMDSNLIEFADADLDIPIPSAQLTESDLTLRMLAELAQSQRDWTMRMLAQLAQLQPPLPGAGFRYEVQRLLTSMLSKGEPLREEVAKRLRMSERTLQRRLAEEGTSFTKLVDDTRREMAQHYLSNGQLSLKKLSFQLGFSDPSAFNRACKRWFGRSPKQLQQEPMSAHIALAFPPRPLASTLPFGPPDSMQSFAAWPE